MPAGGLFLPSGDFGNEKQGTRGLLKGVMPTTTTRPAVERLNQRRGTS